MKAVITGDIVNSRETSPDVWLKKVKDIFEKNLVPSGHWEIFRGDMMQVQVDALSALGLVIQLKLAIKEIKKMDIRMSIGFGEVTYQATNLLESNGPAYVNSGRLFEQLKKVNLKIKSPWEKFDERWNMIFKLALLIMDNWPPKTAYIFKNAMQHENISQNELAQIVNKSQSTVSAALSRAGYSEIMDMIHQFNNELSQNLKIQ